ncbi:MAG TPA: cytochrome c3 family protein [bacterium]
MTIAVRHWIPRLAALTANLAACLFFLLPGPARAWQRDLQAEPLREIRQHDVTTVDERKLATDAAGNADACEKCHSACEEGRHHGGRQATAPRADVDLPLAADGSVTCLTCHRHHGDGAAAGIALRLPNLKRELCLACHAPAPVDEPTIEILSPPERALVPEERVALIGRFSSPVGGHLTVRLNGTSFHVRAGERDFSTWLTLREGVNRCEIALGERVLWSGEIFHGDKGGGSYARRAIGHRTASQQECRECHDEGDEKAMRTSADNAALCYECHDRHEGKRYLHGPLGVGACLVCHDPHSGYGTAHLRDDQALLCGTCHATGGGATASACNARGKNCSDCHDPHQSDARYLLKGPKYTLLRDTDAGR